VGRRAGAAEVAALDVYFGVVPGAAQPLNRPATGVEISGAADGQPRDGTGENRQPGCGEREQQEQGQAVVLQAQENQRTAAYTPGDLFRLVGPAGTARSQRRSWCTSAW